ncbi:hypothetical protein CWT02_3533 [Salmonella enterica subsp. enterica serovar Cubana]|uniref:Uncharacterized protein n=1 Tax=Salmonella enterica subsp. enterica serovar Cubana str. 76814 TaxID=1192560 RepID=V7ITP4_SALET|nr:hypothetical protein A628_01310 [Salmonella enterica subsp. enterica serovar Cubana str. 76814]PQB17521.1 hypothetical protein CWT02_3533 [Salmonella enterica subsp. enterica serovar Cubana]
MDAVSADNSIIIFYVSTGCYGRSKATMKTPFRIIILNREFNHDNITF